MTLLQAREHQPPAPPPSQQWWLSREELRVALPASASHTLVLRVFVAHPGVYELLGPQMRVTARFVGDQHSQLLRMPSAYAVVHPKWGFFRFFESCWELLLHGNGSYRKLPLQKTLSFWKISAHFKESYIEVSWKMFRGSYILNISCIACQLRVH